MAYGGHARCMINIGIDSPSEWEGSANETKPFPFETKIHSMEVDGDGSG